MKKKLESLTTSSDTVTVSNDVTPTFCTFYTKNEIDAIKEAIEKQINECSLELRADILDKELKVLRLIDNLKNHLEEQTAKLNYYTKYKTLGPVLVYDKKAKILYLHRLVNCRDLIYYISKRKGKIIEEDEFEIKIKTRYGITSIKK